MVFALSDDASHVLYAAQSQMGGVEGYAGTFRLRQSTERGHILVILEEYP